MKERRLSAVPRIVLIALGLALCGQILMSRFADSARTNTADLSPPPPLSVLQLAGFGDPVPVGKLLMLYVQAFDLRASNPIPYQALDYDALTGWLGSILELDQTGQYPLHAASRIYAPVQDPGKTRKILEFIYSEFYKDPNRRWAWLAESAVMAKHQLHDLPLAQRYAAAVQQYATGTDVPLWAKQMNAFILEDMNELEQAKIMIGGFIASGQVKEPGELKLLEQRLQEIEKRARQSAPKP